MCLTSFPSTFPCFLVHSAFGFVQIATEYMKDVGQWKVAENTAQQSINAKTWRHEKLVGVTTAEVCKELLKKETDYQKKKQGYVEGTSTLDITKLLFILERHKREAVDDAALEEALGKVNKIEAGDGTTVAALIEALNSLIEKNRKEKNGRTLKYLQIQLKKYDKNTGVAPPPPVMGGGGGPPPPPPPPPPGGGARGIKKGGGKGGASNKRVASKKVDDAKRLRQQLRKSLRPSEQSWWSVRPPPSRAWHLSS